MGDRELIFEYDKECEICGSEGAYEVYGDYVCPECMGNPLIKARRNDFIEAFKECFAVDGDTLSNEDAEEAVDSLIALLYERA